jgi:16S rRNA (guanine(966)-N(2))-methyltransferase RsmD
MRIIGGAAGSRRLKAPPGAATRPTADRVREAIFNILGPPPPDTDVLDLFAGAGALGLEALSRGARAAVLVDRAPAAVRCLRDNVAALGWEASAEVLELDAARAMRRLAAAGRRFRWVFVDPPYRSELAAAALAGLDEGGLVTDDGVVVVESDRRTPPPERCGGLTRSDLRGYGDTTVAFYVRVPA